MSSLNTSTNEVNETKINIDHIEHPERPDDEDSDSEHQKIIEKLKEEFKKVKEIEIETKDDDGILEVPKKGVIGLNNM
jgi:hypothetical protein